MSFAIDGSVKAMAAYGAAQAIPGQLAAGEMLKEGAPIFLSLILMGFVSILPFLMVFSLYSLSSLMTLTMVFFGLNMFYLMWGIAFWVDNHLTTALSQGYSLGAGIFTAATNPTQTVIIMWVQRFMYLILPMFWMTSLSWVGFKGIHMAATEAGGLGKQSQGLGDKAGGAAYSGAKSGMGKASGAYAASKERKAQIQKEIYLAKKDR